jgi:hypothetical protein
VLSLENVAVICGLLFRSHTSVVLLGVLLLKFPLCRALLRLRLAAAGTLLLWETFTMLVAVVNQSLAPRPNWRCSSRPAPDRRWWRCRFRSSLPRTPNEPASG